MRDPRARDRLRLAIGVANPALADRIASVLADVDGLELVSKDDEPDAVVVGALGTANELEANIELTARELEVLALLAEGASNKLIGRRLGISAHTAKYHVASVLAKLDAHTRTEAVTRGLREGLLPL